MLTTATTSSALPTANPKLIQWVDEMARLCRPERVRWCDGSEAEREELTKLMIDRGEVERLDPAKFPGGLYGRSDARDVARVEDRTFICSRNREDAGPMNNWMAPDEAYRKLGVIFEGSMKGRTMYVVPFLMGIPGSQFSKIGIEITDSTYVALNMRIMTRMGKVALDELGPSGDFTRGLHATVGCDPERRYICHFPEDNTIWSTGSNYGGNVLLGKKCLALRIASALGRREGWMAEHMLIMGVESPDKRVRYVAAAFPSQCGKTNLAMLVPPASMPGWKTWTVGDDIAWLRIGEDGRLWAVNPEYGFFGVAPGTNSKSNPNAMATVRRNTIFTNVAKTPDGGVWWEGMDGQPPAQATDWLGRPWTPASKEPAAHPNARFTAPASQCPSISPEWENPRGVPISAIVFGGRRAKLAPLVYQSLDWEHGVYVGATMASETTAAATGQVGVVRRDPMAMLPFCGYHIGDYFGHWIAMGKRMKNPPCIFHVNWFRKDDQGKFLWPGYGENIRALRWILDRAEGKAEAERTPIGWLPRAADLDTKGLDLAPGAADQLLAIDREAWKAEAADIEGFFTKIGDRLPQELKAQRAALIERLSVSR